MCMKAIEVGGKRVEAGTASCFGSTAAVSDASLGPCECVPTAASAAAAAVRRVLFTRYVRRSDGLNPEAV